MKWLRNWAVRYVQEHPEDTIRFKLLLIQLLCHFAKQTTNTLDDALVDEVARHLIPYSEKYGMRASL